MSKEEAAPVPRSAKSTLKPRPSREFICVVGGCCNSFNGWVTKGWKDGVDDEAWIGGARPRTRAEIAYYVGFKPQSIDVDKMSPDELRKHGWWEGSAKELERLKWKGSEIRTAPTHSHDIYWGNFVNSASRIYNSTAAWDPPVQRPTPRPGDIVTFLVYAPSYEMRGKVDFAASPYNVDHRLKPDAAPYWGGTAAGPAHSAPGGWDTAQNEELKRRVKEKDAEVARAEPNKPLSEEDINFHIMMRTTGENTDEYIKKPKYADHYIQYLHDALLNSVTHKGVMAKLLLFRTVQEVVDYISKGVWDGYPLNSYDSARNWDNPTEDDLAAEDIPREKRNFVFTPPKPVRKDASKHPLKWKLPWYSAWNASPSVDRKKVRVQRFDYVGHSITWNMLLDYGWNNEKGFWPDIGYTKGVSQHLLFTDLDACFSGNVLTGDAHAMLWGCNLGMTGTTFSGKPSGLGPYISKHFGGGVVACDDSTSFTQITKKTTNMPTPDNGHWTLYPHRKKDEEPRQVIITTTTPARGDDSIITPRPARPGSAP